MLVFTDPLWLAATLLAVLNFASLSWAVRGHFVAPGGVAPGMRLLAVLTAASFAWFAWDRVASVFSRAPVRVSDGLGLVLLCCGMALFWWAVQATRVHRLTLAFSGDSPAFLNETGPYAWVRHPFYLSYVLFWIATAVLSSDRVYWIVPATMIALYVNAARREEAKFASSHLAAAYARYKSQTAVLPRPTRATRTRTEP